jgi:YHS domain-containing protein
LRQSNQSGEFILRRRTFISAIAIATVLGVNVLPNAGFAAQSQIYTNSSTGIAINGYDPVAYFTEKMPVEGSAEISALWKGAKWHFASDKNRQTFLAMPDKYAPQYGGYCAFAVSYGSTATTVPESVVNRRWETLSQQFAWRAQSLEYRSGGIYCKSQQELAQCVEIAFLGSRLKLADARACASATSGVGPLFAVYVVSNILIKALCCC